MDESAVTEAAETASALSYASQGLRPIQWSDDQRAAFAGQVRAINEASIELAHAFGRAYLAASAQLATEMARSMRQRP